MLWGFEHLLCRWGICEMSVRVEGESLTPGTLIDGARMYAAGSDAVNDRHPNSLHVTSHMLGMSIELTLKAFLRYKGYSVKRLKSYGHSLGKLFDAAVEEGFYRTGSRNFVIRVLGVLYEGRIFGYPEKATMNTIAPSRLREMANELIEEVFSLIHGSDRLYELKGAPGLCIQSQYLDEVQPSAWAMTREEIEVANATAAADDTGSPRG
jgi:hypothetical protein